MSKPYLCHMHIQDNMGIFDMRSLEGKQKSLKDRLLTGDGDLHLPIGWGVIPFGKVFNVIGNEYDGVYMMEHNIGVSKLFYKKAT